MLRLRLKTLSPSATQPRSSAKTDSQPGKAVLAMVTGLLGLFAMMTIAWALHDGQTAHKRREHEKRRRDCQRSNATGGALHPQVQLNIWGQCCTSPSHLSCAPSIEGRMARGRTVRCERQSSAEFEAVLRAGGRNDRSNASLQVSTRASAERSVEAIRCTAAAEACSAASTLAELSLPAAGQTYRARPPQRSCFADRLP